MGGNATSCPASHCHRRGCRRSPRRLMMRRGDPMSFRLAYSTLHWPTPDLELDLPRLRAAGWEGWEARQSLDWLGPARRVRRICEAAGIAVAAVCGPNVTLSTADAAHAINRRRIEFAAELEVPTFMTKGPGRLDRATTDDDLDR